MERRTNPAQPRPQPDHARPFAVLLLYICQLFLSFGAIGGGLLLIIDPSGGMIDMPLSILERGPFSNFLLPGTILLIVFGFLPMLIVYGMIKRPDWKFAARMNLFKELHYAWTFSLYMGFGLIIWIMAETYIINSVDIVHVFYMSLGLLIQVVTLLPVVQRYFMLDGGVERR